MRYYILKTIMHKSIIAINHCTQKHTKYSSARGWAGIKKTFELKKFIKSIVKNNDFNVGLLWGFHTFKNLVSPNK